MGKGVLFNSQESVFFVKAISKRKRILFGAFSATITMAKKNECWKHVSIELVEAGFEERSSESLKKKWSNLISETKEKMRKKKATGAGAVVWLPVHDLVVEVLGQENPKLVAIDGGVDTSSCTPIAQSYAHLDSSEEEETMPPPKPIPTTPNSSNLPLKKRRSIDMQAEGNTPPTNLSHLNARKEHEKRLEMYQAAIEADKSRKLYYDTMLANLSK
jgi:hypothetical protein